MKLKFDEIKDHYTNIELVPETPEEVAQLLRFTSNSKREVPQVDFRFGSNEPHCTIFFKKLAPSKQLNSINND